MFSVAPNFMSVQILGVKFLTCFRTVFLLFLVGHLEILLLFFSINLFIFVVSLDCYKTHLHASMLFNKMIISLRFFLIVFDVFVSALQTALEVFK